MSIQLFRRFVINMVSFVFYYSGLFWIFSKILVRKNLFVFNYHSFNTFVNDHLRIGSLFSYAYGENFERQIQFLSRHFNKLESLDLQSESFLKQNYLLTFDDGYKDNFDIALPILKKYSVPAIFFITTSVIGTDNLLWYDRVRLYYERNRKKEILGALRTKTQCRKSIQELREKDYEEFLEIVKTYNNNPPEISRLMMNWKEAREIFDSGIMIGSHSHTHPVLGKMERYQQMRDIQNSIEFIKNKLDFSPFTFSYPEGLSETFNRDTIDILKTSGIKYAFTTMNGINTQRTHPYYLKRIGVNPKDSIPILAFKIIRAACDDIRNSQRLEELRASIKQYGMLNSISRITKKTAVLFGLDIQTYYILYRDLVGEIKLFDLPKGALIKSLSFTDFKESKFYFLYPQSKRELYKKRFADKKYHAFGMKINGELVYITWITTDFIKIDKIGYTKRLKKGEGALMDSYTLSEARGLGIHRYMNGYRLKRLREIGAHKVYVAFMAENVPALKTQVRHNFKQGEKITRIKWGKLEKYMQKNVTF